jgi:hypothetical protein
MGWSPADWGDFSTGGVVVFIFCGLMLSLQRGWVVLGTHHREVMSGKDDALKKAYERSVKDAETIDRLTTHITEKTAVEQASAHLLQAMREIAERPVGGVSDVE